MIDWATVSSLATAGGTLVLAVATFSSVRAGARSARIAEQALLVQTRPVLAPSRSQDEPIKVMWGDDHWARVPGGCGVADLVDGRVYLSISLRNLGAGIAVIQSWYPHGEWMRANVDHGPIDAFRPQQRDLYVATGDVGFWQGAIRDADDPGRAPVAAAIANRERFSIDILYTDHNGGQRAITRFTLMPMGGEDIRWLASVARHWNLDRPDPR